jgi:hypothetical protein
MSAITGSIGSILHNLQSVTSSAASVGSSIASTVTNALQGTPHHKGGHGGGGLRSTIESAVEQALSSATPGSNVDQTIQTAIENVLKGQTPAGTSATGQPTSAVDDTDSEGSAESTFSAFLKANGVDQQQFTADLQAAFQSALGSGQAPDLSSVFSQLPAGSELDVNA